MRLDTTVTADALKTDAKFKAILADALISAVTGAPGNAVDATMFDHASFEISSLRFKSVRNLEDSADARGLQAPTIAPKTLDVKYSVRVTSTSVSDLVKETTATQEARTAF